MGILAEQKIKLFYDNFSADQIETVKNYLIKRRKIRKKEIFKIVFDISSCCNLNCIGCGTSAFKAEINNHNHFASLENINDTFQKICKFSEKYHIEPFIYIGGGEPLLHPEIISIIHMASDLFDKNVGIDTNANAKMAFRTITKLIPYLSYIGISLNGMKEYHNWWTGDKDSFDKTVEVIKNLCLEGLSDHFEVTSIVTRKNIKEYQEYVNFLKGMNVKNVSIHRAMPVGRMLALMNIVPDNKQYFKLLYFVAGHSTENFKIHLHHSIEDIHSALLLGEINEEATLGNPEKNSAIGINFDGNVYFDPWCTSGCWRSLNAGNLFKSESLDVLLDKKNTQFYEACQIVRLQKRCNSCQILCSGGSRVAAAANAMYFSNCTKPLKKLTAIDPACPLYEEESLYGS